MPLSKMARAMTTAFGATVAAGAAQLGIGYGLGVFSWLPTVEGVDEAAWLASLAWTVWISATAVVIGSVVAKPGVGLTTLTQAIWRTGVVLSATLGGVVVAILTALPSRVAQRPDTFAPEVIVAGYALTGVIFGFLAALVAVNVRAFAANLVATTAWLWLLAGIALADALGAGRDLTVAQLGMWHMTADGPWFEGVYLPGAVLWAAASVSIGALAAWPAVRAGNNRIGVALSGLAGPALVAGAYLLAAPVLKNVEPQQLAAHVLAPYAVLAGLLGSVLVAGLTGRRRSGGASRSAGTVARQPVYEEPTTVSSPEPKVTSDAV
jgi:hypothetical protein